MVDIVDTLIEILCQQGTQSECTQFLSSYPDVTQQLVFFILFPVIFLLIFVNLIAGGVTSAGYKTLVAIGIFIFIIFQGWYHYFLNISKFWFIGLIILGGIYVVTHKMGAASGGGEGGGKGEKGGKAATQAAGHWLREAVVGTQKLDPRERARNAKKCDEVLRRLNEQRQKHERNLASIREERSRSEMIRLIASLDEKIIEVEDRKRRGQGPD